MSTPTAAPASSSGPSSPSSGSAPSGGVGGSASPATSGSPGQSPAAKAPSSGGSTAAPTTPPGASTGGVSRFTRKDIINGKEVELAATEDELWASYRKTRAADERFEAAAKMRKEAEAARARLERYKATLATNPAALREYLREEFGVENPADLMANALQATLEEEERMNDPNVRERTEAQRRAAEAERKLQEYETQQKTAAFEAEVNREMERIGQLFTDALATVDLPADDDTLQIMATLESENRRRGLNLDPAALASAVQDRVVKRGAGVLKKVPPEKLLAIDPELTQAFRKAMVAEFQAKQAAKNAPPPAPAPAPTTPSAPGAKPAEPEKRARSVFDLRTI
ncbi:MAG: hypothetical protein SFW67_28385 [Myxococcaceae bacterium]|nr:hypothetical protein [Myxococcaceae bacterium]